MKSRHGSYLQTWVVRPEVLRTAWVPPVTLARPSYLRTRHSCHSRITTFEPCQNHDARMRLEQLENSLCRARRFGIRLGSRPTRAVSDSIERSLLFALRPCNERPSEEELRKSPVHRAAPAVSPDVH